MSASQKLATVTTIILATFLLAFPYSLFKITHLHHSCRVNQADMQCSKSITPSMFKKQLSRQDTKLLIAGVGNQEE